MDRRLSIKTLFIISAGAALLPSCSQNDAKSSLSLKNIRIDGKEETLLAAISKTIIPKTSTPGAGDVSAHLFALMMVDDCYPPDAQDKFLKGMNEFEDFSKKKLNKSFVKSTSAEREELLQSIEDKKEIPGNVASFYNSMRRLTLQAYTTSEYYLTQVQGYKLVPGKFQGCVPVKWQAKYG